MYDENVKCSDGNCIDNYMSARDIGTQENHQAMCRVEQWMEFFCDN